MFKRDLHALDDVFNFIQAFVTFHHLDHAVGFALELAIEELFTNMVKYNAEGTEDIFISFAKADDQVVVTMLDLDSEPFDLTEYEAVDVEAPLQNRQVGGLGIHLVKRMMDEVRYEYKDRQTKIRLVKKLPPSNA